MKHLPVFQYSSPTFSALAVVFKGSVNLFGGYGNPLRPWVLWCMSMVCKTGYADIEAGDPSAAGTSSVPRVH